MTRYDMIERIGNTYITSNIEGGEYSYVLEGLCQQYCVNVS